MPSDFDAFAKSAPDIKKTPLCKTRKGRENFAYSIGNPDGKIKIFLTSRHHACENTGTFAMQGILEEFLKKGGAAEKLLKDAEIVAIPFIDLDGVLDGDPGEGPQAARPQPRLFGIADIPVCRGIPKALQRKGGKGGNSHRARPALPFHVQGRRGQYQQPHVLCGGPDREQSGKPAQTEQNFGGGNFEIRRRRAYPSPEMGRKIRDALEHAFADERPHLFGVGGRHPKADFACSAEIPYTDNAGVEVNAENLRGFGANIAKSLAEYFASPEAKK